VSRRVLIIGGAGFIGSHLAARCVREGAEVHALLRPEGSTRRLDDLPAVVVHRVHLSDPVALARCLRMVRADTIFHLAAATSERHERNGGEQAAELDYARDLITLIEVAAEHARPQAFVRAGSLAEYGPVAAPFFEFQAGTPATVYGKALLAGTRAIEAMAGRLQFPVVTARFALVYGPGQAEDFLIPMLIRRCLGSQRSVVRYPGDRRDLLFVGDAVDALCRIEAAAECLPSVLNIATGRAPTMGEVARLVTELTGVDPSLVAFGPTGSTGDIPEIRGSPDLARTALRWCAGTSLSKGLAMTVAAARREIATGEVARVAAERLAQPPMMATARPCH
jgi:UDP-glucose 4-epimerase